MYGETDIKKINNKNNEAAEILRRHGDDVTADAVAATQPKPEEKPHGE